MADVVIRGIEMPEGDLEYVQLWVYGDGRVYVSKKASAASSKRLPDLAVPLPEGHGRLGDLTEIEKKLQKTLDGMGDRWLSSPTLMAQRVAIVADLKKVKEAPTIIPSEGGAEE